MIDSKIVVDPEYIELSFCVPKKKHQVLSIVEGMIRKLSPELYATRVKFNFKDKVKLCVYSSSTELIKKIKKKLESEDELPLKIKHKKLKLEEWWDHSDAGLKNVSVGSFIFSNEKCFDASEKNIYLKGDNVTFGDGRHPTTQIAVELIEKARNRFLNVLDVGTGTGILSLVAWKCGARRIEAFDCCKKSVQRAEQNFKANDLDTFKIAMKDLKVFNTKKYHDLVVANIPAPIILRHSKKFFRWVEKEGYLILSGIHETDFLTVKSNLKHQSFRCLKILKKRGWCGLLLKRIR